MGMFMSTLFGRLFGPRQAKLAMMGLDGAGKTTVLYKLKLNEVVTTIPTIGFNVEQVNFQNLEMTIWDIGGQGTIRNLWRHYLLNNDALIYIIDSNDRDRLEEARDELWNIIQNDDTRGTPLLIFANKQDLPMAATTAQVTEGLGLHKLTDRPWYMQSTCAKSGEGLVEGLTWLSDEVKKSPSRR